MARKIRDHYEPDDASAEPELNCWLCSRPMGNVTEWHHPVPKSRGGKARQPVHPLETLAGGSSSRGKFGLWEEI